MRRAAALARLPRPQPAWFLLAFIAFGLALVGRRGYEKYPGNSSRPQSPSISHPRTAEPATSFNEAKAWNSTVSVPDKRQQLRQQEWGGRLVNVDGIGSDEEEAAPTERFDVANSNPNGEEEDDDDDADDDDGDLWRQGANNDDTMWKETLEAKLREICTGPQGHVSQYWMQHLRRVTRPSARELIKQLVPSNALGYDHGMVNVKKGTLMHFAISEKEKHPNKVILLRVGEFFETYGVDAIMLVEWASLNSMAGRARAGCPYKNVQATLNGLTQQGELSVAVYEEIEIPVTAKWRGIKQRYLAQIVSAACSTYMHDLCLSASQLEFRENRPYVGIEMGVLGYSLVQVRAVETLLLQAGYTPPLFLDEKCAHSSSSWPFLPPRDQMLRIPTAESLFHVGMLEHIAELNDLKPEDFSFLISTQRQQQVSAWPFSSGPRPIYLTTAEQIGLAQYPGIPGLVEALLPENKCPKAIFSRRHEERMPGILSTPHKVVSRRHLKRGGVTTSYECNHVFQVSKRSEEGPLLLEIRRRRVLLPNANLVPAGKLVSLLKKKQGNAAMFREVYSMVKAMVGMLSDDRYQALVPPLLVILAAESGREVSKDHLLVRGWTILKEIKSVIAPEIEAQTMDAISTAKRKTHPGTIAMDSEVSGVLNNFFIRNEHKFRGHVLPTLDLVKSAYASVERHATALAEAIADDYPARNGVAMIRNRANTDVKHGDNDNGGAAERRTRILDGHKSDEGVQGQERISSPRGHRCFPSMPPPLKVRGMIPYWMEFGSAVPNSFDFEGIYLLTAPNMAGKSTFMRSLLTTALLGNCGLYVPAVSAYIPRYDSYFLRATSHDIPSEGKSAFALEMDDLRIMLRDSTPRSLLAADEIGKGTSSRDGASLCGALLEYLSAANLTCIFATHLHEVFQLPLLAPRVRVRRMAVTVENPSVKLCETEDHDADASTKPIAASDRVLSACGSTRWHYKLEPGICTDSLALETAKMCDIPFEILQRAAQLEHLLPVLRGDDLANTSLPSSLSPSSSSSLSSSSSSTVIAAAPAPLSFRGSGAKSTLISSRIINDKPHRNNGKNGDVKKAESGASDWAVVEVMRQGAQIAAQQTKILNLEGRIKQLSLATAAAAAAGQKHSPEVSERAGNSGMYRETRRSLTAEEANVTKSFTSLFPQLSEIDVLELVRFSQRIGNRTDAIRRLPDERSRRRCDFDVVEKESLKWRNHCSRFHTVLLKRGILDKKQWRAFMRIANEEYRPQYFSFFTSEQTCQGSFSGVKCSWGGGGLPNKVSAVFLTRSLVASAFVSHRRHVCGCGTFMLLTAMFSHKHTKVDFLYASESERRKWVLDHSVEVQAIARSLAIQKSASSASPASRFGANVAGEINGTLSSPSSSVDIARLAHALLSLDPHPKYGAPNLMLRCSKCDSSKRHHLSYGETQLTLLDLAELPDLSHSSSIPSPPSSPGGLRKNESRQKTDNAKNDNIRATMTTLLDRYRT
eukprot:jgi/Bigna1/82345/fgenesh1_pg.91_\